MFLQFILSSLHRIFIVSGAMALLMGVRSCDIDPVDPPKNVQPVSLNQDYLAKVQSLIESPAYQKDSNYLNYCSNPTPLYEACKEGHLAVVQLLIQHGASLNIDCLGRDRAYFPLHIACVNKHKEVVKWLIENGGADIDQYAYSEIGAWSTGITPLGIFCGQGDIEMVKWLVGKGANINQVTHNGTTPLYEACSHNCLDIDIVRYLIEQGGDINQKTTFLECTNITPLRFACENGNIELVKLFLQIGKVDNSSDPSLLEIACQNRQLDLIKFLIEEGEKMGQPLYYGNGDPSCLDISYFQGNLEAVKYLMKKGAKIDQLDSLGATPLWVACRSGRLAMVEFLLMESVGLDIIDKPRVDIGTTPLHEACEMGHLTIVQLLLEKRAKFDEFDKNGKTPLLIACEEGHLEVVKALLQKGAYPNMYNKHGAAPLHMACFKGYLEIVKELVEHGAWIKQASYKEYITPLMVAQQKKHTAIVEYLEAKLREMKEKANDYMLTNG